ncbi:hypothetical protein GV819_25500 [Pseudomonas sp. Fl5BN2]|uniref:hypothetical protein n=1 Tax=Pseudomonas sp. Fl5BN2 TaxID=2697652 RepID=UPI001377257E|nr:hypothetical protein [Pseudomonas sp. Fl5BN2]NBF05656.1 hypothetical protein [Pseudomonas sp. Fl5BN2]
MMLEQKPRQVYWTSTPSLADGARQIVASMNIDLPCSLLDADDAGHKVMFATVINIEKIDLPGGGGYTVVQGCDGGITPRTSAVQGAGRCS